MVAFLGIELHRWQKYLMTGIDGRFEQISIWRS